MRKVDGRGLLIDDLKVKNQQLRKELDEVKHERDFLRYSLQETRNSFTYKIGMFITWIPRKIRRKR